MALACRGLGSRNNSEPAQTGVSWADPNDPVSPRSSAGHLAPVEVLNLLASPSPPPVNPLIRLDFG